MAAASQASGDAAPTEPFIAAGTYGSREEAAQFSGALSPFGNASIEASGAAGSAEYSVVLRLDGRGDIDSMLQAAWAHGAPEAIVVRD